MACTHSQMVMAILATMMHALILPFFRSFSKSIFCVFRATKDANDRKLARRKFRQAMREDILSKAPGMKFVVNLAGKKQKMTPRVIHALGKNCFEFLFSGN